MITFLYFAAYAVLTAFVLGVELPNWLRVFALLVSAFVALMGMVASSERRPKNES